MKSENSTSGHTMQCLLFSPYITAFPIKTQKTALKCWYGNISVIHFGYISISQFSTSTNECCFWRFYEKSQNLWFSQQHKKEMQFFSDQTLWILLGENYPYTQLDVDSSRGRHPWEISSNSPKNPTKKTVKMKDSFRALCTFQDQKRKKKLMGKELLFRSIF